MGVSNSPHTFQEKTNKIFRVFEFIEAYINDLVIVTRGDWSHHLENLELTLEKLKDCGLRCNINKSFFGQTYVEYLGF